MKRKYTIWQISDEEWLLEIDDEKLGDWVKDAGIKVERFGVGINIPLRVFKVNDCDVLEVEAAIENHLKTKRVRKIKNEKK